MATLGQNICSRCGKLRVVISTHKEKIGNSVITVTETACPDKDCQGYVNKENIKDKAKRDEIKLNSEKRRSAWGAKRSTTS